LKTAYMTPGNICPGQHTPGHQSRRPGRNLSMMLAPRVMGRARVGTRCVRTAGIESSTFSSRGAFRVDANRLARPMLPVRPASMPYRNPWPKALAAEERDLRLLCRAPVGWRPKWRQAILRVLTVRRFLAQHPLGRVNRTTRRVYAERRAVYTARSMRRPR